MHARHPLQTPWPKLWLISDQRNDAGLEQALQRLPHGSGFIYRHYHLAPEERIARYQQCARIARARGHWLILADSALTAKEWGADGIYGAPLMLGPRRADLVMLATAHNAREIGQASRMGADAVLLSPVYPTRSHPGGQVLGPSRFLALARQAPMPVIALGGMTQRGARRLQWPYWAAIDGLGST